MTAFREGCKLIIGVDFIILIHFLIINLAKVIDSEGEMRYHKILWTLIY